MKSLLKKLLPKPLLKLYHYLMAELAVLYYRHPSRHLIVIGVTGTKGKSTACRLIASVLEAGGYKVGLLSTVEFQIAGQRWPNTKKMTMLGRGEIQKMLKKMVQAGCRYAVVETSSQGILQSRHLGLLYDIAVFTNLSPEHIEAHGGFENLKKAKGKIFADLKKHPSKIINQQKINKVIVANADDPSSGYYLDFSADEKWAYSLKNSTSPSLGIQNFIKGEIVKSDVSGSEFVVNSQKFALLLVGSFNVSNALAAIAVGQSQKISSDKIAAGLRQVGLIAGRMEFIDSGQNFKVIVDYAHEPLSLSELFKTLRQITPVSRKIIAIIGSDGGGRDVSKRFKMGEITARLADIVIITDVNCFDEDPRQIAEMLAQGARSAGKVDGQDLFIEINRRQAIAQAFSLAQAGDAVAITAKGTEPYIAIAQGKKIPWDDRLVARELLSMRH